MIDLARRVSEIKVFIQTADRGTCRCYANIIFVIPCSLLRPNTSTYTTLLPSLLKPLHTLIYSLCTHHIPIVNSLHETQRKGECQLFISLFNYLHNAPPIHSHPLSLAIQIHLASRAVEFTRRLKVCNAKISITNFASLTLK